MKTLLACDEKVIELSINSMVLAMKCTVFHELAYNIVVDISNWNWHQKYIMSIAPRWHIFAVWQGRVILEM